MVSLRLKTPSITELRSLTSGEVDVPGIRCPEFAIEMKELRSSNSGEVLLPRSNSLPGQMKNELRSSNSRD